MSKKEQIINLMYPRTVTVCCFIVMNSDANEYVDNAYTYCKGDFQVKNIFLYFI